MEAKLTEAGRAAQTGLSWAWNEWRGSATVRRGVSWSVVHKEKTGVAVTAATKMPGARSMLITGASSGIGEGLALEFARRGYGLAIAARRLDRLEALAPRLLAAGASQVVTIALDVADTDAIEPAVQRAAALLGRLDVIVANAGVGPLTPTGRGKLPLMRETININLTGAIATIEAALPIFRAQGCGHVVGVTSVAGSKGLPGFGAYSASKAGLHRYLQSLRAELRGSPVVVTELAPGFIDTDLNRNKGARPFLIGLDQGAAIMARMIERQVGKRWVPVLPWTIIAQLLKILPASVLAPRQRRN